MERIELKGGEAYYTDALSTVYEVKSGEVLAYIVPQKNEGTGRRLLLGSFSEGESIPGFAHDSELLGSWKTMLVALDVSEIEIIKEKTTDELLIEFASKTKLPLMGIKGVELSKEAISPEIQEAFTDAIIEKYNRNEVKQDGYIYATIKEKEYTNERTLKSIQNSFIKGSVLSDGSFSETGNKLYDAVSAICRAEHIDIAPLERIEESSGHRFAMEDIARVSHFAIRKVVLEGKWFKQDCGPYLAYMGEKHIPCACIPKGPSKYIIYNPKTGESHKLTEVTASEIDPEAYTLYRSFPEKEIGVKDLISFGVKKVYRSDIVRLIITGLLGVLIGLLMPILNEYAYDSFIPGGDKDGLLQIGVLLLSCSLGAISFTVVKNIATLRSLNAIKYSIQTAVFDRLFHLPESFYREYDAAELGIRSTEISNICLVVGSGTITAVISFIFSFLYLFQMFKYGGSMAFAAIVILAIVVIFVIVMGICQTRFEKKKLAVDIEAQSMMYQTIRGVSKLRMAGAEERSLQRYVEKLVSSQKINEKSETITNITMALMSGSSILFSIIFYTMMVNDDMGLSVGEFAAFTSAFGAFSMAMFTLAENFLTVNMVKPMYENMKPILQTLPESTENAAMPGDLQGEIEITGVTFGYDKEQEPVLKDFSLHVRPGEYIGVVGPSGCGKSTLLKLLLGFEKPQRGKIYYDNLDIDSLDKAELRKKFGVVLQDGGLISGNIYENISITAPDVTRERVDEVVDGVGLGEDIAQMPMGLHTVVSEESGTISGGQKQRILIARAIIGKPKLIFLDEATSALDNTIQAQIVETLDKLDATKIVIAHRLSTVIGCDRIIVMDEGRIKEEGTYDELMKRKGMFYELASRQLF